VLLVVVDTLRSDHVGAYGHVRDTTPALDALAARGLRFERAYATAPWTKPSVASILTGLHSDGHGIAGIRDVLGRRLTTLAERLRAEGYATYGVVSHVILRSQDGFGQGFDVYLQDQARGHAHVSTPGVTRQAVGLLRRAAREKRPFLLFVHYFDPHYEFRDHPHIDFAPEAAGRLDGSESIEELRALGRDVAGAEVDFVRRRYDEEIRLTDEGLERLLAALEALGLSDRTVVVVTADHGEELYERGWLGHTRSLHEELLRVPLVIRAPGMEAEDARVVKTPVSLASVTPTLLELAGVERAGADLGARSLAPFLRGETPRPAPVRAAVDYSAWNGGAATYERALVAGRYKLVQSRLTGALRLYDLEADPGERRDLAGERPELAARLARALPDRERSAGEAAPRRALSDDELARLRALGYAE